MIEITPNDLALVVVYAGISGGFGAFAAALLLNLGRDLVALFRDKP